MTVSHPDLSARVGDCGPKVIDFFRVGLFASSHSSLNWWPKQNRGEEICARKKKKALCGRL